MTGQRPRVGVGVVGFGWMGQAHSRSYLRIPSLFPDRSADPVLVACSDTVEARRVQAVDDFGFAEATDDWRKVAEHPDVDVVVVTAPNMLHVDIVSAAAAAGRHVFCEKPVGGTPAQTVVAERAARAAGVVSGVGYNYRWAPVVQLARQLIVDGRLGQVLSYQGRFLSCYGNDPLGLLSWRFLVDQGGYGVSTDLLSHVVDLAHFLVGPIASVSGTGETFIRRRPLPSGAGSHYDRGQPGDPTGEVTNEDWFGAMARFEGGAVGEFEVCRTFAGPESHHTFELYGTEGSLRWDFERMNELELHLTGVAGSLGGFTTIRAGDHLPFHGRFVPGRANGIGFEDLVTIEDAQFLEAVAARRPFAPGFDEALACVSVQDALLRSWRSGRWEDVRSLRED